MALLQDAARTSQATLGAKAGPHAPRSGKIAASAQHLVKHLSQPTVNHAPRKPDDTSD
jgi:hypothetical protein